MAGATVAVLDRWMEGAGSGAFRRREHPWGRLWVGMRLNPPKLVARMGIAKRLESIKKVYGTSIILSEETYLLAQQVIEARELDLIRVAGKTEPVRICGSGPFPADGSNSRGMITHSALRQTEIR